MADRWHGHRDGGWPDDESELEHDEGPYLIVVIIASLRAGLVAGTVASVFATLCYNFLQRRLQWVGVPHGRTAGARANV